MLSQNLWKHKVELNNLFQTMKGEISQGALREREKEVCPLYLCFRILKSMYLFHIQF